jgi:cytochrome c-type biogenesis protein CcmH/NrfG
MQRKQAGLMAASLTAAVAIYWGFTQLTGPRPAATNSGEAVSEPAAEAAGHAQGSDPHEWQMLQQQLEAKPGHVPILLRMAQIALERRETSEAARLLRQAVEQEPGNLDARLELGRALYESGDMAAAITETEQILKSDPNHVDALYNLGAIYANTNQVEQARSFWTRAVASDPGSESGHKAEIGLKHLSGSIAGEDGPAGVSSQESARLRDALMDAAQRR